MHESSLARQILDAVLQRARDAGAGRVLAVRGFVAETEHLSPESIAFHFAAHARGTAAEGATLRMRLVHVEAECARCKEKYAPEHHVLLCPACGSSEARLLGDVGVGVEALDVE